MVTKDTRRNSYSQSVPASKPVSKTFVIIAISVAALVILGAFLLLTKGQFVGKAISSSQVAQRAPTVPTTTETTQPPTTQQEALPAETSSPPSTTESSTTDSLRVLQIDLELDGVDDTHSWVNVYLTSAIDDKIYAFNPIQLVSSTASSKFISFEMSSLFESKQYSSTISANKDKLVIFGPIIFIIPSAKIYVGRAYLEHSNNNFETLQITLDPISVAYYYVDKVDNKKFNLKLTPFSVCIPDADLESTLIPNVNCGAWSDGCGGFVDAGSCADGNVCVANSCQPAGQVLPANAPQYDKAALEQVFNTLNNGQLKKQQKLSAIVNAVKAWLAAQSQ